MCDKTEIRNKFDENVKKQATDAFVIKITKNDDFVDANIDLNVMENMLKNIFVNSWRRDDLNAIEFIDVIEKIKREIDKLM